MQVIAIISFFGTEDENISNKPRDYIVSAPQRHISVGTKQQIVQHRWRKDWRLNVTLRTKAVSLRKGPLSCVALNFKWLACHLQSIENVILDYIHVLSLTDVRVPPIFAFCLIWGTVQHLTSLTSVLEPKHQNMKTFSFQSGEVKANLGTA